MKSEIVSNMKVKYLKRKIVIQCFCGHELHMMIWLGWGSKEMRFRKKLRCGHIFDGILKRNYKNFPATSYDYMMQAIEEQDG